MKTAAFAAVGVLSAAGVFLVKKLTIQAEASSAKSVETVVEKEQEENTRQYMYGIESIISGVCISQDTDSEVNKLGTSCEAVLVGQRVGKNQQESNLDFSKAAADTVEKLENHSLDVEQYLKVTDRDYETLLKIVEAEAGGEDTEGKAGMGAKAKWRKQQRQSPKVQGISACDGKGGRNGACAAGAAENQGHGLSCHQPDG